MTQRMGLKCETMTRSPVVEAVSSRMADQARSLTICERFAAGCRIARSGS